MPIFVRNSGEGVEVIRTRPRRAEMPKGARRRLARDAAMSLLARHGWAPASIADAFGITPKHVRNRIRGWEDILGRDASEAED